MQLMLLLLLLLSRFSRVRLCATHRRQPTRIPCPWDSPGKNTGVGCHFLLQFRKVKSESEVTQSCPTLSDPMDCSLPGSSIHGIFQARVLEWGAIAFSDKSLYTAIFLAQNSCCETALHYLNTAKRHLEQSKEHWRRNSKSTKPSHRNLLSSQHRCSLGFVCLDACFSLNLSIFKARHTASESVNSLFYSPALARSLSTPQWYLLEQSSSQIVSAPLKGGYLFLHVNLAVEFAQN